MEPIRIRTKIESETLRLPQLQPLIGRTVEITIEEALAGGRRGVLCARPHSRNRS